MNNKKLDLAEKTELVDSYLEEMFKKITKNNTGEIELTSDSTYSTGRIVIQVKP